MPVAVWAFDSFVASGNRSATEAQLLDEVLPELASAALGSIGKIRLVERRQLSDLLKEQKLGTSDLADESSRLRLGRLVGARFMLFGSFLKIGPMWQIDLRMVDSESSQIVTTGSASGSNDDFAGGINAAVTQLARRLP